MEIPEEVQNKLKCSECKELLSCGPVYLLHRIGGSICGRCIHQQPGLEEFLEFQNSDKTRNDVYEATASLLSFPCAFASRGCPEKFPFSLGLPPHESSCKFRPFMCPISPPGSCDWTGPWPDLKGHCEENHAANVIENPCNLPTPDLTTTNLQTYILSAFNFLFLLQLKVCLTSGKLFHCMRMYGDSSFLDKFSFKLDVEGNKMRFSRAGSVLRAGFLRPEEPDVVCTTVKCLLGMFAASEATFTIRIQPLFKFCASCFDPIDSDVKIVRFCDKCESNLIKCKFHEKECSFVDVDKKKCLKHEMFFCKHQTKCKCGEEFVGSYMEHLESSSSCRKTSTSSMEGGCRLTRNIDNNKKMVLLSSKDFGGTVICEYKLADEKLVLRLFTALPSHELRDFKCLIKLTDPLTKFSTVLTPVVVVTDCWWDWYINEDLRNFGSWRKHGTDMKINIVRK